MIEPSSSSSSSSSDGYDTEMLIKASEAAAGKAPLQKRNAKRKLKISDSSSDSSDGSVYSISESVNNLVSKSARDEQSEDEIDGVKIVSNTLPTNKRKDQDGMEMKEKVASTNEEICLPTSSTKSTSLVSDLTFCSTSRLSLLSLSSEELNSNKMPGKKKTKRRYGLKRLQCSTVTDKSMDPYTGKLRCRLDKKLVHWPVQIKTQHSQCQMHTWLYNVKYRSQLMHCPTCNVNLCLDCYKPFHEIPNIIQSQDRPMKGAV